MHIYYHSKGMTDLDVMRADAHLRFKRSAENSLIHLHPKQERSCPVKGKPEPNDTEHEWVGVEELIMQEVVHIAESGMLTWNDANHDNTGTGQ